MVIKWNMFKTSGPKYKFLACGLLKTYPSGPSEKQNAGQDGPFNLIQQTIQYSNLETGLPVAGSLGIVLRCTPTSSSARRSTIENKKK